MAKKAAAKEVVAVEVKQAVAPTFFTKREAEKLEWPELGHDEWYIETYQAQYEPVGAEYVNLGEVLEATHRVESLFRQNPVDEKRVKKLAQEMFLVDKAQVMAITLAALDNGEDEKPTYYNVGGRHRVYAIRNMLEQMSEGDEAYLDQLLAVSVVRIKTEADLVRYIVADNTSRALRSSEQAHLDVQLYGGGADGVKTVISTVMTREIPDARRAKMLANYFVRMATSTRRVADVTAQKIGEKVAKYVMGMMKDERYAKMNQAAVGRVMARAWAILIETIEVMQNDEHNPLTNIGRAATELGDKTVSKLGDEFESLAFPPKKEAGKRHLEIVDIQTPVDPQ